MEAQDGNNLVLTIDETVQSVLEKYLAEGVDQFNVKNGAVAIMMDVDTGAILGLATTPSMTQRPLYHLRREPAGPDRRPARGRGRTRPSTRPS